MDRGRLLWKRGLRVGSLSRDFNSNLVTMSEALWTNWEISDCSCVLIPHIDSWFWVKHAWY